MKGTQMWSAFAGTARRTTGWVVACALMVGQAVAGEPDLPAHRGPFGNQDPIEAAKDKLEEKKTKEELETEERLEKLRAAQAQKQARVVVLQWQDSDVDYKHEVLRRNIKTRIGRPAAKFYPDVDLYQAGRKEPDETLRPLDQRARVPESAIANVMAAVRQQESIPWNALDDTEWGIRAHKLRTLADEVWFVDRPELREPLFLLYTQIGRAAENSNNPGPPFFEQVAGINVNYYWYLAAAMAAAEPALMSKLLDQEMYGNIDNIKRQIDRGDFKPMTLHFELAGKFDIEQFGAEYKVYFGGVPDLVTNQEAVKDVSPGMMDIFLERPGDGYGMSVRLEDVKLDDEKIYGVRDQARKRMGLDFIKQLMKNPNQCIPDLDGDILTYLAIYQKLHPSAEIYVAVPEAGSVHRIHLWRWNPSQGILIRIEDQTGGFPVRFVALLGTGLTLSGASVQAPEEFLAPQEPDPANPLAPQIPRVTDVIRPKPSAFPISYELRGHWNRLMVGFGLDFALNLNEGVWREVYQTKQNRHVVQPVGATGAYRDDPLNTHILTETQGSGPNGNGELYTVPKVKELTWQRGAFLTVGAVLGKDAAFGFGPRLAARTGWYNAPHAVDLTGHLGWSIKPPLGKKDKTDTRVFPVIDTDLHGGVMLPFRDSIFLISNTRTVQGVEGQIQREGGGTIWVPMAAGQNGDGCLPDAETQCKFRKIGNPIPTFGFTLKAGLTF